MLAQVLLRGHVLAEISELLNAVLCGCSRHWNFSWCVYMYGCACACVYVEVKGHLWLAFLSATHFAFLR